MGVELSDFSGAAEAQWMFDAVYFNTTSLTAVVQPGGVSLPFFREPDALCNNTVPNFARAAQQLVMHPVP